MSSTRAKREDHASDHIRLLKNIISSRGIERSTHTFEATQQPSNTHLTASSEMISARFRTDPSPRCSLQPGMHRGFDIA